MRRSPGLHVMLLAAGIAAVIGAALVFTPVAGSVGGTDPRVMGAILMLAGGLGILLPLLRIGSRWDESTVRSRQDVADDPRSPVGTRSTSRPTREMTPTHSRLSPRSMSGPASVDRSYGDHNH